MRAKESHVELSPLKLQKLLYILYARCLAEIGAPLFDNPFEAWKYGPVVTDIYEIFKKASSSVREPMPDKEGSYRAYSLSGAFGRCFDEVWGKYGHCSAGDLVELTHRPDSAWTKTYNKCDKLYGGYLSDDDIRIDGDSWFDGRC
jgi:uncharacterized phage-associated protein